MFWLMPSKPPTRSEYAVLVVSVSILFMVIGIVALVAGFRAPPGKHEIAVALEHRGAVFLGVGLAIAFGYWLYRRVVS
jgi:hypothetical protein